MHSEERQDLATGRNDLDLVRSPVDISKVEASDTVQSYLSTSYTSKRTRITANADTGTCGRLGYLAPIDTPLPIAYYSHPVREDLWAFLWPASAPYFPTVGRLPTRWDRSCPAATWKFLLLLYCGLSCVVGTTGFYTNIFNRLSPQPFNGTLERGNPHIKTMEQYLTRSLAIPDVLRLEPFVLSNNRANSSVTICAWITDLELHYLARWSINWHDSISLLVITTTVPASPSHKTLLKTIQQSVPQRAISGTSVHVLHVAEGHVESPNLYLNLARLFALTDWILLFPGDFSTPLSQKISDSIPSPQDRRDTSIYILSKGSNSHPFPARSPLLLQGKHDFWCTERLFSGISRVSDWSECLWQVSLETIGKMHILNAPLEESVWKENGAISEGAMSRRLSTRFRVEMCDAFIKQISLVHPRGRYKEIALDWVKSFCTKTVNKKYK